MVAIFPIYDALFSLPIIESVFAILMGSTLFFGTMLFLEYLHLLEPVKYHYGEKHAKYPHWGNGDVLFPYIHSNLTWKEFGPLKIGIFVGIVAFILAIWVRG